MQKLFTLGIIFLSGTVFSSAYAQDIYGSSAAPAGSASQSNQVMTNEQFKNKVDSLSKQTKNSITQQVDDQLKGGTPITGPTPPGMQPSEDSSSTSTQTPPAPVQPAPAVQQPAAAPSAAMPTTNSTQSSKPAASPSSQPYTGFGGGQAKPASNSGGEPKKSGGNWNVGY